MYFSIVNIDQWIFISGNTLIHVDTFHSKIYLFFIHTPTFFEGLTPVLPVDQNPLFKNSHSQVSLALFRALRAYLVAQNDCIFISCNLPGTAEHLFSALHNYTRRKRSPTFKLFQMCFKFHRTLPLR